MGFIVLENYLLLTFIRLNIYLDIPKQLISCFMTTDWCNLWLIQYFFKYSWYCLMSQIMECKFQTKLLITNSNNPSLNPGQCSMDYGQWADHPLTIDHCWLGKGCSNPGPMGCVYCRQGCRQAFYHWRTHCIC